MDAASQRLIDRGLLANGALTAEGRNVRDEIEERTDRSVERAVAATGSALGTAVEQLNGWSQQIIDAGWFPPDPYKRASG